MYTHFDGFEGFQVTLPELVSRMNRRFLHFRLVTLVSLTPRRSSMGTTGAMPPWVRALFGVDMPLSKSPSLTRLKACMDGASSKLTSESPSRTGSIYVLSPSGPVLLPLLRRVTIGPQLRSRLALLLEACRLPNTRFVLSFAPLDNFRSKPGDLF